MKKLISIIIPVYNEERNIPLIYASIKRIWQIVADRYDYEIIFINDGSQDQGAKAIENLVQLDNQVKYMEFSRNFGKEAATSAGLHWAQGDAAIIMDADLQHPTKIIIQFLARWESGADVVIGIRIKNNGEGLIRKIGSHLFYKIMNLISETKIVAKETDFRLLDKKVIEAFNQFTERERMTRGLIDWLGFKREYIGFQSPERKNGHSTYSKLKLIKLATSSFVSYSLFPLKFAGYLGIGITVLAGVLGVFIITENYILHDPLNLNFSGPAILAVINLFLVGIILSCLGLIALYIATINREVTNRPMYVISRRENI